MREVVQEWRVAAFERLEIRVAGEVM